MDLLRAISERNREALAAMVADDGRIAEITLLLRPLATLQTAVVRMARALAEGAQPDA